MNEESTVLAETSEETLRWPLPFNVSLDKLDIIIKAFFQAQADTRPVLVSDLVGRAGLNLETIKRNIKFLSAIGIIKAEEEKEDYYSLEEKGAAYAKSLSVGNAQQSSAMLKDLLVSSYLKELIDFVELRKCSGEKPSFELIFSHIKTMARLKENPKYPRGISTPYAVGISTIIDLLIRAGMVAADVKTEKETARAAAPVRKTMLKGEQRAVTGVQTAPMSLRTSVQGLNAPFPFTINITVEAKDPESIKQLINLIKELKGQTEQSS